MQKTDLGAGIPLTGRTSQASRHAPPMTATTDRARAGGAGGPDRSLRPVIGASLLVIAAMAGCHASKDDAAGQARELKDPVRREHAVGNLKRLYGAALAAAQGDRDAAGPKAVADASVEALTRNYIDHPEDRRNQLEMLRLLAEMQDARALPAFLKALEWRPEVSEQDAVTSAQALRRMEVPEAQRAAVVEGLSGALDRVQSNRPVDNRMRIEFIRALGALGHPSAVPVLRRVAIRIDDAQNFLINRIAAEQLGHLADASSVPDMVKGLFLFAPNAPQMRMNDLATQALVQVGRPALAPLLALLRGENEDVNGIITEYIAAVRRRSAAAARQMNATTIRVQEAAYALGQLGFREAIEPLIRVAQSSDLAQAQAGAVALVSINRSQRDIPRVRRALIDVYRRVPKVSRTQLLVAMQHTYDAGLLDFLHAEASRPEDELPDIRVLAVRSYAFLSNRAESARLKRLIQAERGPAEGGFRTNFEENQPSIAAAESCDAALPCWVGKLDDSNPLVVRKAAYMVARYGRANASAVEALVARINHRDPAVRGDVLYALDWVARGGSEAAVTAIENLREEEGGRSSWEQIKTLAMAVSARLRSRQT